MMKNSLGRLLLVALLMAGNSAAGNNLRLISTDAGTTELLAAMGFGDQLVAVDVTSDMAGGGRSVPNVGYHRNLSAEGLLNLQPTHVIGNVHMGPPVVMRALEAADVRVIRLPSALDARALRSNIATLARAIAAEPVGEQVLARLDETLSLIDQPHGLEGVDAVFLLAVDGAALRLAGRGTAGDAFIHLLGANNLARFNNYQSVSAESLLALRPALILVAGAETMNAATTLMARYPVLSSTPAGRQGAVLPVEGGALVAGLSLRAIDQALAIIQGRGYAKADAREAGIQ